MSANPPEVSAPVGTETSALAPWVRWGWIMGAVWLVFLGFPIAAIVMADVALGWRLLALLAVLVFALVYVRALRRLDAAADVAECQRVGIRHLLAMAALVGTVAVLIGAEATGMLPFVVSLAILSLPLAYGLTVTFGCVALAAAAPLLGGDPGDVIVAGIILLVAVIVLFVRTIEERESEHKLLTDERTIAEERDRVARDVHDVLGHSLTVVTVKLELAERLVDLDPERAKDELAQARSMTRQALAEIRATVAGLRVARLTEELDRVEKALADAGIEATLPDDPSLVDPRHRIALAWSLREAVTNVVRHSGATRCEVAWGSDWLTVTDNGVGMGGHKEGNGIRGLRERAAAAAGVVEVGPGSDGSGTTVRVQL